MTNTIRPIVLRQYWYGLRMREAGKRLKVAAETDRWSGPRNRAPDDYIKIAIITTEATGYIRSGRDTVWSMREIRHAAIGDGTWTTR
jgi:hypothetical protein